MKKGILIVDDEDCYSFLTRQAIERVGFPSDIKIAENGKEALEAIKESSSEAPFDLVLLDINMPIMNGFQFLEAFKSENFPGKEKICLALLTSSEDPDEIEKANSYGVKYYFLKPLAKEDFLTLIKKEFNYSV